MIRCYFYAPTSGATANRANIARIRASLDRPDIILASNVNSNGAATTEVVDQASTTPALEHMDAFVIEGTVADAEIGFLLAHAIALRKPTLYLYQRGTVAKILSHVALHELPAWIQVVSYAERNVERQIEEFLLTTGGKKFRPSPRIKFTLRITSFIDDYLRYKTINTKQSKADWVRDRLEQMMADDDAWQRHVREQRRTDE